MSEHGYFAVSRRIFDHPIFAPEPFTEREAWMWLIKEAAWQPRRTRRGRQTIDLERGQLAHALRFMAERWRWSEARVRRFLKRLKTDAMIDVLATREATHITICNYDEYQSARRADETETDAPTDALATRSRRKPEEINHSRIKEGKDIGTSPPATAAPDPAAHAIREFNQIAIRVGLAQAQSLTPARRKAVAARLRDCGGIEGWQAALAKIEASDFLTGRSGRTNGHEHWSPNLDWFLKASNFTKLMEGVYDNKPAQHHPKSEYARARAELREFAFGRNQ